MAVKYVFVTGGVVSGLGKGITAASLGRLLKMRGYKVTSQKFAQTIVMITHNEEIDQLADRIIRIEDGRIVTGR